MYNRYVPKPDGSYQRNRIPDPKPMQNNRSGVTPPAHRPPPPPLPCPDHPPFPPNRRNDSILGFFKNLLPKEMDTGDLIIVLLLLLIANDSEENKGNALLTLALYFIL